MNVENKVGFSETEEHLQSLIDETIREIFQQVAKIDLRCLQECPNVVDDVCTVYTTFSGGYQIRFGICTDRTLMKRIAENMAEEPVTDAEDIEEYMKEFVNIICGHVVARIFNETKTSARFHPPCFTEGHYVPADDGKDAIVTKCYINEYLETAVVLHDRF